MKKRIYLNLGTLLTSPVDYSKMTGQRAIITWTNGYSTWKEYVVWWVKATDSSNWEDKYSALLDETMFDLLMLYVAPTANDLNGAYFEYDDELDPEESKPNADGLRGRNSAQNRATVNFYRKVYSWLVRTSPRYLRLLDLYKAQEANLMKKVETRVGSSEMPQSATLDTLATGLKDDLSHARIELAEGGTPMERISEIQQNYENLMQTWADEFIETFVLY